MSGHVFVFWLTILNCLLLWFWYLILDLFLHCGILDLFLHCGILDLFLHCGILDLFLHCGILDLFLHCGIFCFTFYYWSSTRFLHQMIVVSFTINTCQYWLFTSPEHTPPCDVIVSFLCNVLWTIVCFSLLFAISLYMSLIFCNNK